MVETAQLTKPFASIGARVKVRKTDRGTLGGRLDVGRDRDGEYFDLAIRGEPPELQVLNIDKTTRHLLLRMGTDRLLCGHDERHWFVAGIADRSATTVRDAKISLIPRDLRGQAEVLKGKQLKRRNELFKRQGEWFFVPAKRDLSGLPVLRDEPIQRGTRSTPHMCEELIRFGGEVVRIVGGREYSDVEYREAAKDPRFARGAVRTVTKNPEVYVKGAVRHPDHATLTLVTWHRVLMNAEMVSSSVAFYD